MLGKGLASLIPSRGVEIKKDEEQKQDESINTPLIEEKQVHSVPPVEQKDKRYILSDAELRQGEAVFHIELDKIHPNPYQPRREFDEDALKELAHSIQEYGIIQPLVVSRLRKEKDSGTDVEYQIIAGERRWRAAKMAGLPRVPVVVRKEETSKGNLELALVENLQRSNLNPVETARAYSRLQDEFGLTQREVAQRVGKSREAVANTLRLLNLPSEIQDAISSGKIGESQARILLGISDLDAQRRAFQGLLEGRMSVRTLKEKVKDSKNSDGSNPEKSFFEKQLEEKIGAPVHISKLGDGGKVVIRFFSDEEMQGVLKRLLGEEM
ncbi:MAG: ParB/RepB/Spo0J family partition protein [bacterium]|nr:ParB/RepB/Spo0J family partition protein [bacterium]